MERMQFKMMTTASKEKLWETLWSDTGYPAWTAAFTEGSKAVTDWKKGSRVLFLDNKNSGMVSVIEERIDNEFMSFCHLGEMKNGVEDMESAKKQGWAGSHENYTLRTVNGATELIIDMSSEAMPADMLTYFENTWPKALAKLKELAEQ